MRTMMMCSGRRVAVGTDDVKPTMCGLSSEDFEGARFVRLEKINELRRLGRLDDLLTRRS